MKKKASQILSLLDHYFPHPEIPLKHTDSYTLLIAVILSAQCTDKRVNAVTPKLFSLANTPKEMAELSKDQIETIIRPCGLAPTKARAIHKLSQILIEKFQGRVPKTFKSLESLPGVGHKTASVVMAQAFDVPAFPVDTHIHRCAKRWKLSSGKNVRQTEKDLKRLFPRRLWQKIHLQMILFARKYCPAKGHDPHRCPICTLIK